MNLVRLWLPKQQKRSIIFVRKEVITLLYYEGLQCPVCKKPFTDSNNIVVCPECGLPHHRDCWNSIGQCAAGDKHGTNEQWSREKARAASTKGHVPPQGEPKNDQVCPHCFTRNSEYSEFCNHCGRHLKATDWHSEPPTDESSVGQYMPFRTTQVNPENYSAAERIGDYSAADLAAMVGNNTRYYMPRFRSIAQGGSGGWNFCAFLFGPYWLLIRKIYWPGILLFIMQTVLSIATVILYQPFFSAVTEQEMITSAQQIMTDPFFAPVAVLTLILFAIRILLAFRGNQYYKLMCEKKIRSAREKTKDISSAELSSIGGISVGISVLFYFISYVITEVITFYLLK